MVKVGREITNPGRGALQRGEGEVLLDDRTIVSSGVLELGHVGSSPVDEGKGVGLVTTGGNELETVGGNEGVVGGNEGVVGGNEGVTGGNEGVTVAAESDDDDDEGEGGGDGTTDCGGGTGSSIAQGRTSPCLFTRDLWVHSESLLFLASRLDGSPGSIRTLDGRRIIIVHRTVAVVHKKGEVE